MATIKLIPSAYTRSSTSRVTVTGPTNMYYDTSHTANYCSIRGRNSSSSGPYYAFIHGFNIGSVPEDAIVSAITVRISCYRNSYLATGSSYRLRLASTPSSSSAITNTTMSSDVGTSRTVYTIPTGNLDWDDIKSYGSNFSIEVPLMSTSNQYPYLYVYGAEIEVTYTLPVYHNITASSSVSGVTITPTSETVVEGDDITFTITSNGSSFIVKDNNVDVTSQLVQIQPTGSNTETPDDYSYLSSGVTINGSYPFSRAQDNADDTADYCRLNYSTSTTGYIELTFNLPSLPAGATVTGVSARARLRISSTTRMTNRICQLYSGSTAKGSNVDFSSTSSGGALVTLSTGSWTANEISNLKMRVGATSSSSTSSKYVYIYGADVTVSYTLSGEAYTYTISNVTADHTVVISGGAAPQDVMYVRVNGSWTAATAVYKKVSGSWVLQSNLSNVFDSGTNYKYVT